MLHFVRIQIFEAKSVSSLLTSSTVDRYNAAPPIYLAFPDSSPHLIHSYLPPDNVYLKTVFQALTTIFSQQGKQLSLKESAEIPVKSLAALSVLKGSNRSAQAQGAWGVYARGEADSQNNPLEPYSLCTKRRQEQELEEDIRRSSKRGLSDKSLQKLTNLRFHGNIDYSTGDEVPNVQFSSAEFLLKSEFKGKRNNGNFKPTITLRLHGSDVFGGIKDLAMERIVDVAKMPGWMTGERGASSGVVENGRFRVDQH